MSNLGCAVEGCSRPVIGQCMGYKDKCGRFYCGTHSQEKLCDECATVKKADELLALYENTARSVKPSVLGHVAFGYFVILGIGGLPIIIPAAIMNNVGGLSAIFSIFILLYAVVLFFLAISIPKKMYKKKEELRLAEARRNLKDFDSYYAEWKRQNKTDALKTVGVVAIGLVIGTIAMTADNSVNRDIREIKDRISRL